MRLEYKILWIEDNPTSIKRDKRKTIEYIESLGFQCSIKDIIDFKTFEVDIGYENTKHYDLLLVDLDLGDDGNAEGNVIIREVRDEKVYTEIVFYSSHYEQLQKKLHEQFVEGIFTSSRDELEDKIIKIIDVTIRKTQDVNNLRDLIMAEVAELDRIKEKIIIEATSTDIEFNMKEYILKTLRNSYNDNLKKVETYKENDIATIFKKLYVDSDKKARSINKFETSFDAEEYRRSILSIRNKFAHIEECDGKDKNGNACKMIGDIEFTEDECIRIRQDIKSHKRILENILQQLNG